MNNLSAIIKDYLSKPTNYAIQIVGNFGYGKSYHYKATLDPLIADTPTHVDNSKKYKPIYISLFGLKSIEEIDTKIVLTFFQSALFKHYFKKKLLRRRLAVTGSVFKVAMRGFLNFSRLGNVNEYLTDIKTAGQGALDTNELLICLDDIERKDEKLTMHDISGYINALVDEGTKVVIISNEDILKKHAPDYKDLKEKIIGITVDFVPDATQTVNDIIKIKYKDQKIYREYLASLNDLIVDFALSVNCNFRHLIYALDRLHICYSLIRSKIIDPKHQLSQKVEEQLRNITSFILAISAEYKMSNLNYSNMSHFTRIGNLSFKIVASNEKNVSRKEEEKTKLELLFDKYGIESQNYYFYESIFAFLTGYNEFSIEQFIVEFKRNFNLENGKVLPQYEVLQLLSYNNWFNLTDDEYHSKTLEMIFYAESGLYSPADYLSVMYYAERLNNVLNLNLQDVFNKLVKGLKLSIASENSEVAFSQFQMSGQVGQLSPRNVELHQIGMDEITIVKQIKENSNKRNIAFLLFSDFQEFVKRFENDRQFSNQIAFYPVFEEIDAKLFFDFILKADKPALQYLIYFFQKRYQIEDVLKKEIGMISDLEKLLSEYLNQDEQKNIKPLRNYLLTELASNLNVASKRWTPPQDSGFQPELEVGG